MPDNETKSKRKPKYLSVRKALQELKLNEEDLRHMMDNGQIKAVYENNEVKFDEDEVTQLRNSAVQMVPTANLPEEAAPRIEDEDLYRSTDSNYESLFLSRSGISASEKFSLSQANQAKANQAKANQARLAKPVSPTPVATPVEIEPPANGNQQVERSPTTHASLVVAADNVVPGTVSHQTPGEETTMKELPKTIADGPPQKIREVTKVRRMDKNLAEMIEVKNGDPHSNAPAKSNGKFAPLLRYLARPAVVPICLLVLVLLNLAVLTRSSGSRDQAAAIVVKTGKVQVGPFVSPICYGSITPAKPIIVIAPVGGKVAQILVADRKKLAIGQPLIRLENASLVKESQTALAMLKLAELKREEALALLLIQRKKMSGKEAEAVQEFCRQLKTQEPVEASEDRTAWEKFLAGGLDKMSAAQWQLYNADLQLQLALQQTIIAKNQSERAKEQERSLLITAPSTGELVALTAAVAMPIAANATIAVIADPLAKAIAVKRSELLPFGLSKEVALEIKLCSETGRKVSGVWPTEPSVSLVDNSYLMITLTGDVADLAWGTTAGVQFLKQSLCLQLPKESIVVAGGSEECLVFCAIPQKNGHYLLKATPVKTGLANDRFFEIIEGLTGNEIIVTGANVSLGLLSDGMMVAAR